MKWRNVKTALAAQLTERQYQLLRHRFLAWQHAWRLVRHGADLAKLAALYGTDKWGRHRYAQHYQRHLAGRRWERLNVLEIGVGGNGDPKHGGQSLRMWRTFFPRSRIYGIDLHDKSYHDERRIRTFSGSQADTRFLEMVAQEIGRIDVIVDDGSHVNEHVIQTFQTLFPKLSDGGLYAIEDTQTAYWPQYGGTPFDVHNERTSMGFLKRLVDGLNWSERPDGRTREATYYEAHVVGVSFYHNLVFIWKGKNE